MSVVIDIVGADSGQVVDTITYDSDKVSYATGAAEPIVAARLRLFTDPADAVASLMSWSNGYLSARRKDT
jgi:hypothetical protein